VVKKTSMELIGALELEKELKAFGSKVAKRAANSGTRKAAMHLRRAFKAAAPRVTGTLRKSLTYRYYPRSGVALVGLRKTPGDANAKIRYYYKTLEFGRKGGRPLNPFFAKTWNKNKRKAARIMVKETRIALYEEAGKEFIRSKRRRR